MKTLSVLVAFFLYSVPFAVQAADTDIVINEIAAYESGDYEWIEIFNKGTGAVDITGWKFYEAQTNHKLTEFRGGMVIPAGGYAVIANKADKIAEKYPSFTGILIDSSWGTLAENGEEIGLKDASGDIVELFTYITAKKTSLERKNAGLADYTDTNWSSHPDGHSIGVQNSNVGGEQEQQQQQQQSNPQEEQKSSPPSEPRIFRPMRGDVLINELVSDPADREDEWVELYNTTQRKLDLSGWSIEDGAGVRVMLSGELDVKDDARYSVISASNGFLGNPGDRVILRSPDGTIIDEVTYGNWDDGDVRDNAVVAIDPFALARVGHTYYNRDDFRVTSTSTKGASNKITEKKQRNEESVPTIIISELVPNPLSLDPAHEFIELHNPNNVPVNIGGWELLLLDDTRYIFPSDEVLPPRMYRAYSRMVTNLALKNSGGERIRIYPPYAMTPSDEVRYVENAPLGQSYSRDVSGLFQWSKTSTPNTKNEIARDNRPPRVVIHGPMVGAPNDFLTFNAADTIDEDGDQLTFHWEFGDMTSKDGAVVHHVYQEEDAYPILLTVSDGKESVAQYHHIVIEDRIPSERAVELFEADTVEVNYEPFSINSIPPSTRPASSTAIPAPGKAVSSAKPNQALPGGKSSDGKTGIPKNSQQSSISTPLNRVRSLKSGTPVRVEGVVAVAPGIFSANYFYIAGSGIQIWNPKKEFPRLERGDRIVVSGTIRKNGSEHAVRIDGADAIRVILHEDDPVPYETSLADIGELREGELVRVTALVADTRWPNIYLEDGDVRVRAYITRTTDIGKEQFRKGEEVTVTGIVSETSAGYRILPRDKNDVENVIVEAQQAVLGEKVDGPQILTIPERTDPRKELFKYFVVTLLATLVVVGALGYQYYLDRQKRK